MRQTRTAIIAFAIAVVFTLASAGPTSAQTASAAYSIDAVRYGTVPHFPLNGLVIGAPKGQTIDIAMVFWLIRGNGRVILFDSGCHRQHWLDDFHMTDFLSPDKALDQAGVPASSVTDVVISHAHWDHMGGIDLFPNATIWIQKDEYDYYTGAAWQPGGQNGGIDPEDVLELLRRNTRGKLHLVDGDNIEIIPGIRAYTGARHTFASQYICIGCSGEGASESSASDANASGPKSFAAPIILASDNVYLYENLRAHLPSATFTPADAPANLAAQRRMASLACPSNPADAPCDRIVPGHDPAIFTHYPTHGRIAHIQ